MTASAGKIVEKVTFDTKHGKLTYVLKSLLGEGTSGMVYSAELENPPKGKPVKPMVVKKISKTTYNPDELRNLKKNHFESYETATQNYHFILTEHLPGKPLFDTATGEAHPDIVKLNFLQRVDAILQILAMLHLTHHPTASGAPLIHMDIKGDNILLELDEKSPEERPIVHIIDFGSSMQANIKDPNQLQKGARAGSLPYMAPEVIKHKRSPKSDIYSLAAVCALLLGAENPVKNKVSLINKLFDKHPNAPLKALDELHDQLAYEVNNFSLDGIFQVNKINIDGLPEIVDADVKEIIKVFLKRMQNFIEQTRPASEEILEFFSALKQLCELEKLKKEDLKLQINASAAAPAKNKPKIDMKEVEAQQRICLSKLVLLASGKWKNEDPRNKDPNYCKAVVHAFFKPPEQTKAQKHAHMQSIANLLKK